MRTLRFKSGKLSQRRGAVAEVVLDTCPMLLGRMENILRTVTICEALSRYRLYIT